MATVKRNNPAEPETPSQTLVRNALRAEEILDSNGRRIMLRNPGPLAQFRLVQAAGAEAAGNPTYMAMALPLIYVGSIDGAPVPDVMTKAHLEALIQRLDDAGIAAVMENVARIYGRQDPEADKETLKKLVEAAPIRNCLWLVKHGVPFDVAFQLDDLTLAAWCIILAEMEGQVFDWNTMSYKDQK